MENALSLTYDTKKSVDLYLFHQWSSTKNKQGLYDVDIVVKDVGKADPPFKPIDEWYKEIPTITARDALLYARDHVEQALLSYAHYEHLLYVFSHARDPHTDST